MRGFFFDGLWVGTAMDEQSKEELLREYRSRDWGYASEDERRFVAEKKLASDSANEPTVAAMIAKIESDDG
jgi:hypothetical protein